MQQPLRLICTGDSTALHNIYNKLISRIVSLGDAHELDGVTGLPVWVINQTQLSICFLYLWDLSSLPHKNSLLAVS